MFKYVGELMTWENELTLIRKYNISSWNVTGKEELLGMCIRSSVRAKETALDNWCKKRFHTKH